MIRAVCIAAFALAATGLGWAQVITSGAAAAQLALERLSVTGRALMIAAHPDDENTALLAWLAGGRKVRTGYLSLTRGEGGQNLIGSEQGHLLGAIRTQELLAARRIDGAEQFFTRAVDFGYSKRAQEALAKWDRERVLGDIVWVIRRFQPDVMILQFSGTPRDGHGQHQASAILGKEAFIAAADPKRYPEQFASVRPWKAKRVVWNPYVFRAEDEKSFASKLEVDVGEYDQLLGRSYAEIAGISRSMHRSQAMGTSERRGSVKTYLVHVAGDPAVKDLFEGVASRLPDTTLAILTKASRTFDWRHPERTVPLLLQARTGISDVQKRQEIDNTIGLCAGLWLDATIDRPLATVGESVRIAAQALNRSSLPVTLESIAFDGAPGVRAFAASRTLKDNVVEQLTQEWKVVPAVRGTPVEQPEPNPVIVARFRLNVGGVAVELTRPVVHRYVDPVLGERTRPFVIVPPVSVRFSNSAVVFPSKSAREIELQLHSQTKASGSARLRVPSGWKAEPAMAPFNLSAAGESTVVRFRVTPPPGPSAGVAGAEAKLQNTTSNTELHTIQYPHVPVQVVSTDAKATLARADVVSLVRRVGYIMGAGDLVPDALRQLDCEVILLSADDLATGDLSRFDAIVTGVRAYNVRSDVRANRHRLLEYVRAGGTLVVQYNVLQSDKEDDASFAPYPIKIGRARVSVEEAPVSLLRPDHPLLTVPNRITSLDFEGWIQERGLYFADKWDQRYETMIASADPGEPLHSGGLLYARLGKGAYIFTAYSWFRQLPAGVPGAYRIFANLLSAGKAVPKE
jgi:LmbE family N-acetylglucosaminyl deacetylase